ncbi:MAG: sel1 repeat family protein [Gammaproteobacteria bacterium]|nr:sel1 repeat family protein [Gammaproteobacteria bacterium]
MPRRLPLMLLLFSTGVHAGLAEGLAASRNGDYEAAFQQLEPEAKRGNAEAQYHLGVMYDAGQGVPQNTGKAFHWYLNAAELGHKQAQYNAAVMYNEGRGTQLNPALALQWFTKAAQQGFADAQFSLGVMYANGSAVQQDYAQAAHWYRKAAQQGDADAQYNLALLYGTGKGVAPDLVYAWAWFDAAFARAGKDNARKNRDLTAQRMTPAQLEQAKKIAGDYAVKYVVPFGKSKAP